MKTKQEPKYDAIWLDHVDDEMAIPPDHEIRLVNRASREPIPDDEPVFIIRARDWHAVKALQAYANLCSDDDHRAIVHNRVADFRDFAAANPGRMKEPDSP